MRVFWCTCGQKMRVPEERLGRSGRCVRCGKEITVTYANTTPLADAPAAAAAPSPGAPPGGTSFEALGGPEIVAPLQAPAQPPHAAADPLPPGSRPTAQALLHAQMMPYVPQPAWTAPSGGDDTPLAREEGAFSLGAYFWLAALLLFGCLLPRIAAGPPDRPANVHFVNFEVMLDKHAPLGARLESGYPLLAAVLTIAAAAVLPGLARSIALLLVAGAYLALTAADTQLRHAAGDLLRAIFDPVVTASVGVAASWVGLAGLFAGSRARYVRPGSRISGKIGAIGAAAYLAGLVIPRAQGWMPGFADVFGYWTAEGLLERVPVFVPMLVLGNGDAPWQYRCAALAILLAVFFLIIASLLCLWNIKPRPASASRAHGAFWLWMAHLGVACAGWAIIIAALMGKAGISELPDSYLDVPALDIPLMFAKTLCFRYGMLLLLLMGAADLVVRLSDRAEERRRVVQLAATL